jgi:hypothetical protein
MINVGLHLGTGYLFLYNRDNSREWSQRHESVPFPYSCDAGSALLGGTAFITCRMLLTLHKGRFNSWVNPPVPFSRSPSVPLRTKHEPKLLLSTNILGIVGYIILLTVSSNGVKYLATFPCTITVYDGPGINLTWFNGSVAPHTRALAPFGCSKLWSVFAIG